MNKGFTISEDTPDREYFTIIPNYIVNHSTIYEQGVYLVMKRIAGEQGSCYASHQTIADRTGVSRPTISRTIEKLLKRGWIKEEGKVAGKTHPTKNYVIVDLWELNSKYFKDQKKRKPQNQSLENEKDTSTTERKKRKPQIHKEEPLKEDIYNIDTSTSVGTEVKDEKIDIEKLVNSIDREEHIKYEYQLRGIEIWETLDAPKEKKSEFIRIVRDYPPGFVNEAFSFARDYPVMKIRYMMFFKKLNQLNRKVVNVSTGV